MNCAICTSALCGKMLTPLLWRESLRNLKTKGEGTIIQITKEERDSVRAKLPFVHVSHPTRHHKIYMEEHPKAMRLIERIRAKRYGQTTGR